MGDMLIVRNLSKRFGGFQALDRLTMNVPEGAIYGFIGRNGAGKTTLIRIISGLSRADGGEFRIGGGDARLRMGVIAGQPAMYDDMTAWENMRQQYLLLGLTAFDDIGATLRLVGLEQAGRKKARHFSQGMRQRLGIAMALSGETRFVALDEPVNGLDPQGIIELRALLQRLNRERHVTFLVSSHMLDELSRVATHYGFIDRGRVVQEMTAGELERSLQKSLRFTVDNAKVLASVLDDLGARYRVLSAAEVDVFSPVSVTRLAVRLLEANCEIHSCAAREESLESYFIHLVGGEENA